MWKRLTTEQASLSSRLSALSLLPYLAIYTKCPTFFTETTAPSITPPDRGVATEFFLSKCSLTEEDITKAFKSYNHLLLVKSSQNCEEILELLNGCGLTTHSQIRRVVLSCPYVFFCRAERNMKSKLSFLRTFMKEEDIAKLIYNNPRAISLSEDRIKSAVSLLRKLGLDSKAISELLSRQPCFLTATEKDVVESFKNAEELGFEKGSKMFAFALQALLFRGKEELDRRRLCFGSLGFSEKQISEVLRRQPMVLSLSEEKVKRNVDFLVNSVGLLLDDLVKHPPLFGYSLEKRLIPRYRVMEAMKSMQVPKTKMSFPTFCILSERLFLGKYIHSNAESSSVLLDIYHGGKVDHLQEETQ